MSDKAERLIFFIALTISVITAVLLYLVGPEIFPDVELARYIISSLLYLSGLVAIRGLWKLTLDNKFSSKRKEGIE